MTSIAIRLVWLVEWIKQVTGCRTWMIEHAFVVSILTLITLHTAQGRPEEWLGVLAVWMTFGHASISDRLSEKEGLRASRGDLGVVECYRWERRYFLLKESFWLFYFILLHAWSALVGVGVFLLYRWWRKVWRTYHVSETLQGHPL